MGYCVLDPGHGGVRGAGGSTPNRAVGQGGTLEKDVVLELALAARSRLSLPVLLTRDEDRNLTIGDRIATAQDSGARAFVSLHLNADGDPRRQGTCTFVHRDANGQSLALAERVQSSLARATGHADLGVRRAPLAVLEPMWHAASTAACLVELSFLTDPEEERRLRDPTYRDLVAQSLSEALAAFASARPPFEVFHQVPLVPQTTGMSCWAAAAAMIVGWRDRTVVEPDDIALGSRSLESYDLGLTPRDIAGLARAFGLEVAPIRRYTAWDFKSLLERHGPLWIGHADPDLHVVVMVGIRGDGTPEGSWVCINDPWPIGIGERYRRGYAEWLRCFAAASEISGVHAQVLHAKSRR
jgi:hypothetical protein